MKLSERKALRREELADSAMDRQYRQLEKDIADKVMRNRARHRHFVRTHTPETGPLDLIDSVRGTLKDIHEELFSEIVQLRRELVAEKKKNKKVTHQRDRALARYRTAHAKLRKYEPRTKRRNSINVIKFVDRADVTPTDVDDLITACREELEVLPGEF